MKQIGPCYGCTERVLGCHSDCKRYKIWCEEHAQHVQTINESRNRIRCVDDYIIKAKIKNKKVRNRLAGK